MAMISPGGEDPRAAHSPVPGEDDWDDLEDQELEEYVQSKEKTLQTIRSFVTIADRQFKYVTFGDGKDQLKIKIRAAIPYETRERQNHIYEELQNQWAAAKAKAEELGLDPDKVQLNDLKVQRPMYEILANLCMEDPWNDWRTWAVIDRGVRGQVKGSGMGPVMLGKILAAINETQDGVKAFRGKR
jgi:hypothetical protein